MSTKYTLVFIVCALFTASRTQSVIPAPASINSCLKRLILRAHFEGESLPELDAGAAKEFINNYSSFDSITKKNVADCKLDISKALKRCETALGAGNCEQIDEVTLSKKCPEGFYRRSDNSCVIACPEGYTEHGFYCEKPKPYVLQNFSTQEECEKSSKTQCQLWHVRYWVGQCKEHYLRLGSTVCIGKCPYGTEDEAELCMKPNGLAQGAKYLYDLADN